MTPLWGTKHSSALVGAKSGGDGRAARSLLSCALWRGIGRLWRGMGGVRPPHRHHGLLVFHQPRDTQHGFPLPSGDSKASNPKPEQRVFTKHERRLFSPCMRKGHTVRNQRPDRRARRPITAFLRVVERPWGGYGAAWAAAVPRAGNTACWFFTSHGTRNMFSPALRRLQGEQPQARPTGFHESRITRHGFFRITASLPAISHDFPPFPGISRPPPPPSAVLARLPGALPPPQLPPTSGLVPVRPTHDEPMLRKENIPDCTNSGTFYLALAFARLESPLRSGHHREQRRSGTVRGVTRSTTGRGLRRRDMPSGQETISKRR